MALESLSNALEFLAATETAMNLRQTVVQTAPGPPPVLAAVSLWDADQQYFLNDIARSTVNGGFYVWTGNTNPLSLTIRPSVRGGADPSADATGGWQSLAGGASAGFASSAIRSIAPATVANNAVNLFNGLAAGTLTATVPSAVRQYLVIASGEWTFAAPQAAADLTTLVLTPDGTGAVAKTWDIVPNATSANNRWSCCGTVSTVADSTEIVLSATAANIAATQAGSTNVVVKLIPLF